MRDNWWTRFKLWLEDAIHGDEWLQPVRRRLMVSRGGEIHEECPDCRGECTPYRRSQCQMKAEK